MWIPNRTSLFKHPALTHDPASFPRKPALDVRRSGSDLLAQSSCRLSMDVTAQLHLAGPQLGRRQPSAVKSVMIVLGGGILGELAEC